MVDLDKRLLAAVRISFERHFQHGTSVEAALSGGLDSVVLLDLLVRLRDEGLLLLQAVHVHHGLQPQADDWPAFCENFCGRRQVALRTAYVTLHIHQSGIEAAARKARYEVFENTGADAVALAHHCDDQVETFMLAALRGGGLRALSAMPQVRRLNAKTVLWRPLLDVPRQELEEYACLKSLDYIEDPSNADVSLLRNWLRNRALPDWRERLPQLDRHVLAGVGLLQQELALLDEVIEADGKAVWQDGFFDCAAWRLLGKERQKQQLLRFAKKRGLGVPSHGSLNDFCRVLNETSGYAEWNLPAGRIYAYQNRLFDVSDDWLDDCAWLEPECLSEYYSAEPLGSVLERCKFKLCREVFGLREDVLAEGGTVRRVNTDDVIELTVGHKKVRKLLQECKIPPFVRHYWPVIINHKGQCIAVANLWVHPDYACLNGVFPYFEKFSCFILEPK